MIKAPPNNKTITDRSTEPSQALKGRQNVPTRERLCDLWNDLNWGYDYNYRKREAECV